MTQLPERHRAPTPPQPRSSTALAAAREVLVPGVLTGAAYLALVPGKWEAMKAALVASGVPVGVVIGAAPVVAIGTFLAFRYVIRLARPDSTGDHPE